MKTLNQYVNYTIAQYIINAYHELDDFWKKYSDKLEHYYKCSDLISMEYFYIHHNKTVNIKNPVFFSYPPVSKFLMKHDTLIPEIYLINDSNNLKIRRLFNNKNIPYNHVRNLNRWLFKKIINNETNLESYLETYNISQDESIYTKKLLELYPSLIDFEFLSNNPSKWVREILMNNFDKIDWSMLSGNESEWAGKILKKYPENIDWEALSYVRAEWAKEFFEKNPRNLDYLFVSDNNCDWAIELRKKHNKINYKTLSYENSQMALDILKNNIDKIEWNYFSNKYIFVINKSISNKSYILFDNLIHLVL